MLVTMSTANASTQDPASLTPVAATVTSAPSSGDSSDGSSGGSDSDPIVKPGHLTTEHIMWYVAVLISTLTVCDVFPIGSTGAKALLVAGTFLGQIGYTFGRSMVKSSAHKVMVADTGGATLLASAQATRAALLASQGSQGGQSGKISLRPLLTLATLGSIALSIVLFAMAFGGCTSAQRDGARVMSGDFKTCAKADLGAQVAGNAGNLLSVVSTIVKSNKSDLENELGQIALSAGREAVKCAIYAIENVLQPKTATPTTGQTTPPPGLQRALAWSAATGTS